MSLFEENKFHVVIFDIMLSRTDGWSFIDESVKYQMFLSLR
ncbi:hypothetical protein bmyco0003_54450 [Bacillus pseudomycoides]|nr:hypothetical protein bmyco0003_54450 [Bacillus pseudomycoides]